jgi:hypothetical protein
VKVTVTEVSYIRMLFVSLKADSEAWDCEEIDLNIA